MRLGTSGFYPWKTPTNLGGAARVHAAMFLFFSSRAGCAGSLLITAIGSLILLAVLGWL